MFRSSKTRYYRKKCLDLAEQSAIKKNKCLDLAEQGSIED